MHRLRAEPHRDRVDRLVEAAVVGVVQGQGQLHEPVGRQPGQRDADQRDPALADQRPGGLEQRHARRRRCPRTSPWRLRNDRDRVALV